MKLPLPDAKGRPFAFIKAWLENSATDCVLWPFNKNPVNGYGMFALRISGKSRTFYAHRVMCALAHGDPPTSAHHAAHSCHARHCINPRHLSWKTLAENMLDKRANGTASLTNRHGPKGGLTPEQVSEIRAKRRIETQASLATRFNVTEATIRNIYRGKTYAKPPPDWFAINRRNALARRLKASGVQSL